MTNWRINKKMVEWRVKYKRNIIWNKNKRQKKYIYIKYSDKKEIFLRFKKLNNLLCRARNSERPIRIKKIRNLK